MKLLLPFVVTASFAGGHVDTDDCPTFNHNSKSAATLVQQITANALRLATEAQEISGFPQLLSDLSTNPSNHKPDMVQQAGEEYRRIANKLPETLRTHRCYINAMIGGSPYNEHRDPSLSYTHQCINATESSNIFERMYESVLPVGEVAEPLGGILGIVGDFMHQMAPESFMELESDEEDEEDEESKWEIEGANEALTHADVMATQAMQHLLGQCMVLECNCNKNCMSIGSETGIREPLRDAFVEWFVLGRKLELAVERGHGTIHGLFGKESGTWAWTAPTKN